MTSPGSTEVTENLKTQPIWSIAGRVLRGRVGLVALSAAVLAIGGALNWQWLVAAGVAPLILAVLPCAAMCALGLCAMGMADRSTKSQPSANSDPAAMPSDGASCCASEPVADRSPIDAPQGRRI